jgi:hypothetical protein
MRHLACVLTLGLALACAAPGAEPTEAPEPEPADTGPAEAAAAPPPPMPWTQEFLNESVLMARVVRIEGPPGLREHLALLQDPKHHDHTVRTVSQGLLQTTELREDVHYLAPIRCQLDRLTIVAEERLVVLERPMYVPVTVDAEGDAFWKRTGTEEERRGPTLRLVGRSR